MQYLFPCTKDLLNGSSGKISVLFHSEIMSNGLQQLVIFDCLPSNKSKRNSKNIQFFFFLNHSEIFCIKKSIEKKLEQIIEHLFKCVINYRFNKLIFNNEFFQQKKINSLVCVQNIRFFANGVWCNRKQECTYYSQYFIEKRIY